MTKNDKKMRKKEERLHKKARTPFTALQCVVCGPQKETPARKVFNVRMNE